MNIKQFMPKFLKELRSDNWDQARGNLIKKNDFEDISYCVIGVVRSGVLELDFFNFAFIAI